MADLATYQQAADSIYNPQQQNEAAMLGANKNAQIATLESNKGTINQDYSTAINNLSQSTLQDEGKINQLYNERLQGNISGLQGNDMGMMFARAHQDQTNIETTRANKLNALATDEANVNNKYGTEINGLSGKYNALKMQYAQSAYAEAVKQEQQYAYQQAQLQLRQEALNETARYHNADLAYRQSQSASKVDPMKEFGSYIESQFKRAGGQGNENISRQQQDQWVNQWLDLHGLTDNKDRQAYWDNINSTYNRTDNPYADWRYKR